MIDESALDKIARFFLKYSIQKSDLETVKEYIKKHFEYKTAFVGFDDDGEVTFICRWNLKENDTRALILDLYIREDYRKRGVIQQLIKKGLWLFPAVKLIGWQRGKRALDRGVRYYEVEKLLKQ